MNRVPNEPSMPALSDAQEKRRGFLSKALFTVTGGLFGGRALAVDSRPKPVSGSAGNPSSHVLGTSGQTLKTRVWKGNPAAVPLDTMMLFERSDNSNDRAITHEVVSVIHEEKGKNSYPWSVYAQLTTSHHAGDACVLYSRLHKKNDGWSAGLHTEVFNEAPMVGIGINVEMSNDYAGPERSVLIGAHVMACGPNPCQHGVLISCKDKGTFDKALGLESTGPVGIDVAGKYDVGLRMNGNDIWLNEGSSIVLDGKGQVRIRFKSGRIEFLNGDKVIGHFDVDTVDSDKPARAGGSVG